MDSTMDLSELSRRVQYLNTVGGLGGRLDYEKVAEAVPGAPEDKVEKIFQELETQKDTVKDPTAWVTSAIRKAAGGGRSSSRAPTNSVSSVEEGDTKLRKRIGWLNGDGGGFGGQIIYDKVVAAAGGLPYSEVMKVLKDLEEKKNDVKDPNAWVCSALRKAGGGGQGFVPVSQAMPQMNWGGPPQQWSPSGPGGMWGAPGGYPPAMQDGGNGWTPSSEDEKKIKKRVEWLNKNIFMGSLNSMKVAEAATGISDVQAVMKVLKDVEEKKSVVKDPTAYVTSALRKAGGGTGSIAGAASRAATSMGGSMGMGQPAWGGQSGQSAGWSPDVQSEDQKLRKRIGWLNGQGGFNGAINYDRILQSAGGLEFSEVFRMLKDLEERKDTGIKDPTGWVCVGLKKAAAKLGGGGGMPAGFGGPPGWAGPAGGPWGGAFGGPAAMEDATAMKSKLHKRMTWLNGNGGFQDAINIDKVLEAAHGVSSSSALKILKDLEEKKDQVKDPTAYVSAALRKEGRQPQVMGMMPGVRKTISKR
jgi:hypothetical protein